MKIKEALAKRVRIGGLVYIVTPNVVNLLNRLRFLFGRAPLENLTNFYNHADNFTGHWREYTLREFKQMCVMTGLDIIEASNTQNERPNFITKKWRTWYRNFVRLFAYILPGCGDSNIIIGRKI